MLIEQLKANLRNVTWEKSSTSLKPPSSNNRGLLTPPATPGQRPHLTLPSGSITEKTGSLPSPPLTPTMILASLHTERSRSVSPFGSREENDEVQNITDLVAIEDKVHAWGGFSFVRRGQYKGIEEVTAFSYVYILFQLEAHRCDAS